MKTSIKKLINGAVGTKKCWILLFLFFVFSTFEVIAMEDSSNVAAMQDSGVVSQGNGPSLQNMKKTGSVMTEEVKKMKEKQAREEFLSYVYMVLGFGAVIAVAWFSVSAANKRKAKADERKRIFLENKVANQAKSGHKKGHRR